jgi:voltage-gated potassium channel
MEKHRIHNFRLLAILVVAFITYGTLGYIIVDKLTFTDALLRIFLLFSTLGFSEATTQTLAGKWLTILLIVVGISVIAYTASTFMSAIIEGEITGRWKKKMTDKKLSSLKNHIIVVGFGRLGRQIAQELRGEDVPVVIIDREDKSFDCDRLGYLFIQGDCSLKDDILIKAGINCAKTIILAMGNDSEVLATAVTARALNEKLNIVARANSRQAAERLYRVGVNKVALPAQIGGYHMATMALRPSVVDFLDLLIDSAEETMQIEEYAIPKDSILIGKRVHDHFLPHHSTVSVIAIRRSSHKEFLRPNAETTIHDGDKLILMGTKSELNSFIKNKGE